MGIHSEDRDFTVVWIERKTPIHRPTLQSNHDSLCSLHRSRNQGRGGQNGQVASTKRGADGRRQIIGKILDEKREKYRAKNESLRNTSRNSKAATFEILINHTSAPVRKKN